jgi:hypothetical protein
MWIAVAVLAIGVLVSLRAEPIQFYDLRWAPALVMVALLLPFMLALSAWEYALCGRAFGGRVGLPAALRVIVLGTAANFLPLPGSAMVRVAGLKSAGATYGRASAMILSQYLIWLGAALAYAGMWVWILEDHALAIGFAVAGAALFAFALAVWRGLGLGLRLATKVILIRLGLVLCEAARLHLAFAALGLKASFAQASALSVSGVIGSAFSILPSGLGVSEAIAAVLAGAVGLSAAAGFLVTAFSRLTMLAVLLPAGIALALRTNAPKE